MGKGLKVILKVVSAQALISLLAVIVAVGFFTPQAARSVLIGSAIGLLGTLVLGLRMFYPNKVRSAEEVLQLFLRGELQKFLITVALLVVALKWWAVSPIPFFAAFFLTVVVNWAMLPLIKN